MLEAQKAEAQQVLDELLNEGLLPFKLTLGSLVNQERADCLVVDFYDSRIPSVEFSWKEGESFYQMFRVAVLDRVQLMSGSFRRTTQH